MRAHVQTVSLPEKGVKVVIECNLVRLFFDFAKAEMPVMEGMEAPDDIYECESVDVMGRSYNDLVSGIINDRYPIDRTQAIMANYENAKDESSEISDEKRAEYFDEYAAYQKWRSHAKEIASVALEIIGG
ncbi:MAG: hypothetical protein IJV84_09245 [Bacteroidales bacterium]|nr:hypothetical protein [Bacteroidales bacterium]